MTSPTNVHRKSVDGDFAQFDPSNTSFQSNANAASRKYELLIHSLCHEDNAGNLERHALLLDKWCRDYFDG